MDGTKDKWAELKLEGIKFDRFENVVKATNKDLSIAKTIIELGVTTGNHNLSVLEMQLVLSGNCIVELDGEIRALKMAIASLFMLVSSKGTPIQARNQLSCSVYNASLSSLIVRTQRSKNRS